MIVLPDTTSGSLKNGTRPDLVLGQPDFTANTRGTTDSLLNYPDGVYLSGTNLIVSDNVI